MNAPAPDLHPFVGAVSPNTPPALVEQLRGLRALLLEASEAEEAGEPEAFRRNRLVRLELAGGAVAIKAFPAQNRFQSRLARLVGSKARQSFDLARALEQKEVGTPRPVAYLERWDDGRLQESYYVSEFVGEQTTLHTELLGIFHDEPYYRRLLNLLDVVAREVRAMHDAGIQHGDMGNQNIFVRRTGPETWTDVRFIDLNRGKTGPPLTLRERAFDLSRLTLPSRLRSLFLKMYYRERFVVGKRPPAALLRWLKWFRVRFAVHSKSRWVRHPVRMFRRHRAPRTRPTYPKPRDYWIWDEHTDQPIGMLTKHDKLWRTSLPSVLRMALAMGVRLAPSWLAWRRERGRVYEDLVRMNGRIGVAVRPDERERAFLRELGQEPGRVPVLIRFYRHETQEQWEHAARFARSLHEDGHPVAVALVQDRRAVRDPERWQHFLHFVLDRVGTFATEAEIGHAVNRVKWGVWSFAELRGLLRPITQLRHAYPDVKLIGPAINDFEVHYVFPSLASLPRGQRFDALSLHLYMDRSGPPEGAQKVAGITFAGVDKFTLPKALTRLTRRCDPRVVITEVNWPLGKEGGDSHRFAPYFWLGNVQRDTTAPLDTYADYMVRYYLHALCSGMIERVYWWRLAGQSFGLVDDSHDPWEPRPAYRALKTLLAMVGRSVFTERLDAPDGVYLLQFDNGVVAGFSADGERTVALPFAYQRKLNRDGEEITGDGPLTGSPVYFQV